MEMHLMLIIFLCKMGVGVGLHNLHSSLLLQCVCFPSVLWHYNFSGSLPKELYFYRTGDGIVAVIENQVPCCASTAKKWNLYLRRTIALTHLQTDAFYQVNTMRYARVLKIRIGQLFNLLSIFSTFQNFLRNFAILLECSFLAIHFFLCFNQVFILLAIHSSHFKIV